MGKFEQDFVYYNNPFSSFLRCWFRFIDDVFCIFSGSQEQLLEFQSYINSRLPTIKFTLEQSQQSIPFLDVTVNKSDYLETRVYRKKTDRNSFLDFSSYHPPALKKGLPYSQLVRIKRICSSSCAFEEQAADLCSRFTAKGYSAKVLEEALQRARQLDRADLLTPKSSMSKKSNRIVCATTFSPLSRDIRHSIEKHWHILSSDPTIGHAFRDLPVFAHKRARNLRDTLVRADLYNPPKHFLSTLPSGNFPCHNCIHCNAMIKSESFLHPHSGKKYAVKGRITCKTKYVVYLLKCPCGLCYVGKTIREIKTRFSEHKSSIRNNDEKSSVARHFNSVGHSVSSLRFQGIEVVNPLKRGGDRDRALLQKEAYWIHTLQTEHPKGLNEELLLGCFL